MDQLKYIWPVRCHTCGAPLAPSRDQYEALLADGYNVEEALNYLQFVRTCCRMSIECPGQLAPGLFVEGGATRQTTAITVTRSGVARPVGVPKGAPAPALFPRLMGKPVAVLAPGTVATPAPIAQVSLSETDIPKRPFRAN